MPEEQILKQFAKEEEISHGLLKCRRELKYYIKATVKLQKELFSLSETSVNIEEDFDVDENGQIFDNLESNFNAVMPFVEETIERWNSRTLIIKNLN